MEPEKVVGFIALGWLVGSVLLMARLIRRGRELAEAFATKDPETYEALGRPQPGFLYSARQSRFAQFLARREYETLDDPALSARFEDYRKAEARLLLLVLSGLGIVGMLILIVRYVI